MFPLLIALLMLPPQQATRSKPHTLAGTWGKEFPGLILAKPRPVKAADMTAVSPGRNDVASPAQVSQQTFRDGTTTEDGRMDVMHLADGKMAVVTGRNWHCSARKDPYKKDSRVVLVCDASK